MPDLVVRKAQPESICAPPTPEAVPREHGGVVADLVKQTLQRLHKNRVRHRLLRGRKAEGRVVLIREVQLGMTLDT